LIETQSFGDVKRIDLQIAELRWKNGRRIYFCWAEDEKEEFIILLIGGNKNSQKKDIQRARNILAKFLNGDKDAII
jgi:putative addiction module killer protein